MQTITADYSEQISLHGSHRPQQRGSVCLHRWVRLHGRHTSTFLIITLCRLECITCSGRQRVNSGGTLPQSPLCVGTGGGGGGSGGGGGGGGSGGASAQWCWDRMLEPQIHVGGPPASGQVDSPVSLLGSLLHSTAIEYLCLRARIQSRDSH